MGIWKLDALAAVEATQETVTGVRQHLASGPPLSFFPNPASGELTLSWAGSEEKCSPFRYAWMSEASDDDQPGNQEISLPSLAHGVYWLRIEKTSTSLSVDQVNGFA